MEENNIFEETVAYQADVGIDDLTDDYDGPAGASGPMYQLNFGKEYVRVLLDSSIKLELSKATTKPEYKSFDYKTVVSMMSDLKGMSLDDWKAKYFE